jgi:signal transduction histidine kinase
MGVGLGLYIAKSLVEMHNGRIWMQSQPGEGSTFLIALPLEKEIEYS